MVKVSSIKIKSFGIGYLLQNGEATSSEIANAMKKYRLDKNIDSQDVAGVFRFVKDEKTHKRIFVSKYRKVSPTIWVLNDIYK